MKKISYLLIAIFSFILLTNTVYACSTDDKCANCGDQNSRTSCASAFNSQVNSKCASSCKSGVPATVCEQCKSSFGSLAPFNPNTNTQKKDPCEYECGSSGNSTACSECRRGTSNSNNNNNNNNNGGSNGSGSGYNGGSTTIPDNQEELCELCQSFNSNSNSTATDELKNKCQEAGCPINEDNTPGVITAPGITYKDNTDDTTLTGCEKIFGNYSNGKFTNTNSLGYFLSLSFKIIKYVVPIILIILTSVDFLKGIASSDKEIIKVATSKLTKRAIIALMIFLIPTILNFVLGMVTSYGTCGVK